MLHVVHVHARVKKAVLAPRPCKLADGEPHEYRPSLQVGELRFADAAVPPALHSTSKLSTRRAERLGLDLVRFIKREREAELSEHA